ncbi:MAG: branched-chain amino acid aminotransferase [Xanthomonadales bacterium]|nr:branched-chain amino acid aminotransferase [Xanthomonadales bacterium]
MAAFGTEFAAQMGTCRYRDGAWDTPAMEPVAPIPLHPAAHVLHYSSSCFEGLKAYRWSDGEPRIFRLGRHVQRMQASARLLCLPVPGQDLLAGLIRSVVDAARDAIPDFPGALYLRPTLVGTEPNIGAAAHASQQALLYVLASPVGDYFAGGQRPLRVVIEPGMRSTPDFGKAKTGGNYAAALRLVVGAREQFQADQVLFCPDDDVQETGAANFILLDDERIITKPLDGSILEGVTRDSILTLARDSGYSVEERFLTVSEVLEWAKHGEAALSGTAAVLTGVGTLVYEGRDYPVYGGKVGPNTEKLRAMLTAIQSGERPDPHGWIHSL